MYADRKQQIEQIQGEVQHHRLQAEMAQEALYKAALEAIAEGYDDPMGIALMALGRGRQVGNDEAVQYPSLEPESRFSTDGWSD